MRLAPATTSHAYRNILFPIYTSHSSLCGQSSQTHPRTFLHAKVIVFIENLGSLCVHLMAPKSYSEPPVCIAKQARVAMPKAMKHTRLPNQVNIKSCTASFGRHGGLNYCWGSNKARTKHMPRAVMSTVEQPWYGMAWRQHNHDTIMVVAMATEAFTKPRDGQLKSKLSLFLGTV